MEVLPGAADTHSCRFLTCFYALLGKGMYRSSSLGFAALGPSYMRVIHGRTRTPSALGACVTRTDHGGRLGGLSTLADDLLQNDPEGFDDRSSP